MSEMGATWPDFENPPVIEVLLAVHFERLEQLRSAQLGLLWQAFRNRFPRIEEHPSLPSVDESFGATSPGQVQVRLEMLDVPPPPRLWFLNEAGTELVQIQQDQFVHNWRKLRDTDQYPHYDHVRNTFAAELREFGDFARGEGLGELKPTLCEVTYIDHIVAGPVWQQHGQLDRAVTTWVNRYSREPLPEPLSVTFTAAYAIPHDGDSDIGRLTINLSPNYRATDGKPIFVMTSTARGRPLGEGLDGALNFLDIGHASVVRGFLSMTTKEMHDSWGERDDH